MKTLFLIAVLSHALRAPYQARMAAAITVAGELYSRTDVTPDYRCLGASNVVSYHRDMAHLSVTALRIQQGRLTSVEEIQSEIAGPASQLKSFTKCLVFRDDESKAAWNEAIENLEQSSQ